MRTELEHRAKFKPWLYNLTQHIFAVLLFFHKDKILSSERAKLKLIKSDRFQMTGCKYFPGELLVI